MDTTQANRTSDAIHEVYEQFSDVLKRQAEQIENLSQSVKSLQTGQQQLEEAASYLLAPLERSLTCDGGTSVLSPSGMLASVRRLAAATHLGQLFDALAEQSAHLGVRAAVFDVRGRAAWGASASGFDAEFDTNGLRALVVPLNQEGPFRQVFESAEAVEARPADLGEDGHVRAKLSPPANARILLVPVRSADSVVAVLYAETGEKRDPALIDSLKVLAEFAGGQIDRMMMASRRLAAIDGAPVNEEARRRSEQADRDEAVTAEPEFAAGPEIPEVAASESAAGAAEVIVPTEEEEKIHRDARRFSKLLVSEIELYNRSGVEEGRRNRDLYHRLKKDIDRSRETYEKRFAHTVAKQFDYFHEEVVKTLAGSDPTLLGSGYPGPSV